MIRITGYDGNRVPRVWGDHKNIDVAETYCRKQAEEYVKQRPDTGPLSKWVFVNNARGWVAGRME